MAKIVLSRRKEKLQNFQASSLEAVVRRCSVKKMFLKILLNPQENTCARVYFSIRLFKQLFLKKTLAQVFSYEFCKVFERAYFYRTPEVAASSSRREFEELENTILDMSTKDKQNYG